MKGLPAVRVGLHQRQEGPMRYARRTVALFAIVAGVAASSAAAEFFPDGVFAPAAGPVAPSGIPGWSVFADPVDFGGIFAGDPNAQPGWELCPQCDGNQLIPGPTGPIDCPTCGGNGVVRDPPLGPPAFPPFDPPPPSPDQAAAVAQAFADLAALAVWDYGF